MFPQTLFKDVYGRKDSDSTVWSTRAWLVPLCPPHSEPACREILVVVYEFFKKKSFCNTHHSGLLLVKGMQKG